MYDRIRALISRKRAAAKLGFRFRGTTRTPCPSTVLLGAQKLGLRIPAGQHHICDIINVWLDDEYGLKGFETAPRTVLDVGAHVGIFSLWAWHNFRNAVIHAYEPNPRTHDSLQSNLSAARVKIFQAGLGLKPGRAKLIDVGDSRMASTQSSEEGSIVIESIANAVERLGGSVDLLKMDCEGAEWDIFEDESSMKRVKEIRMEYHLVNGHTLGDLESKAEKLGFSVLKIVPNDGFGVAWLRRPGAEAIPELTFQKGVVVGQRVGA